MQIYFLALIFKNFGSACESPPAKRICSEPVYSDGPQPESASSDTLCDAEPSFLDTLCDACFGKFNSHLGEAISDSNFGEAISHSNFRELHQYLGIFNENYNCYRLAENENYREAIAVLFKSDQKTLLSAIYALKLENEAEMELLMRFLIKYCNSVGQHCAAPANQALHLYKKVMSQVFRVRKTSAHGGEDWTKSRNHARYYGEYHHFLNSIHTSESLSKVVNKLIIDIKRNTGAYGPYKAGVTNAADRVSYHFYDALLPRLAALSDLTDEILSNALSLFIYKENNDKYAFRIVSFQPVYALARYKANNGHNAINGVDVKDRVLKKTLLDKRRLETESIFSMLRVYKLCERFPFPLFINYTILVHNAIFKHSTVRSDNEKRVLLGLHRAMIIQFLPLYCQKLLSREGLIGIEKLKAGIPAALASAIDEVVLSCIREQCNENGGAQDQVTILLYDCCKARDHLRIASLFSEIHLTGEQVLGLLKAVSAQRFDISAKVSILRMLVECDVLNADIREYITNNLGSNITNNLGSNTNLIITYSLALISHAYRAKKSGQKAKNGVLETYLELCARHLSIFTYADGPHSAEYYALHAYDIFFNHYHPYNDELKAFWEAHVLVNYQINFFTGLWNSLSYTPNDDVLLGSTPKCILFNRTPTDDEGELIEMNIWAFKRIRLYCKTCQNLSLLHKPVHDLIASNLALSDIYIHYFDSDPQFINYLIIRYFYCSSEIRAKRLGFKVNANGECAALHREAAIMYLKTHTTSLLKMDRAVAPITELRTAIRGIHRPAYRWVTIDFLDRDKKLYELAEKMVLAISDVLLSNMGSGKMIGLGEMSGELLKINAISSVLSEWE